MPVLGTRHNRLQHSNKEELPNSYFSFEELIKTFPNVGQCVSEACVVGQTQQGIWLRGEETVSDSSQLELHSCSLGHHINTHDYGIPINL